jgi:hypothetical protein
MRTSIVAMLVFSVAIAALGQSSSSKYEVGTIMAVRPHATGPNDSQSDRRYDISVQVGDSLYVVLYTQPPGTISPVYRAGLSTPVLVKGNSLRFNDSLGRSKELPILSRKTVGAGKGPLNF